MPVNETGISVRSSKVNGSPDFQTRSQGLTIDLWVVASLVYWMGLYSAFSVAGCLEVRVCESLCGVIRRVLHRVSKTHLERVLSWLMRCVDLFVG